MAAHASGKAADGILGPTLQFFLMADPQLRPYVKDVSFAAPAAAAVGTIPAGGARPPHDLAAELRARAVDHPQVVEGDGKPMKYLPSLVFQEQLGLKQARSEV